MGRIQRKDRCRTQKQIHLRLARVQFEMDHVQDMGNPFFPDKNSTFLPTPGIRRGSPRSDDTKLPFASQA